MTNRQRHSRLLIAGLPGRNFDLSLVDVSSYLESRWRTRRSSGRLLESNGRDLNA